MDQIPFKYKFLITGYEHEVFSTFIMESFKYVYD